MASVRTENKIVSQGGYQMRKSQEDEDIEKIFQKSRMTTEAPIVKQEVDQEKPKELENTMYRSAKGWIETLCSAAETAGHIPS